MLLFPTAVSAFAVGAGLRFLRTATEKVISTYHIDACVQIGTTLLVAPLPSFVYFFDFIEFKERVYDHLYNIASFFTAGKKMKVVD